MPGSTQNRNRTLLIAATVIYILSLCLWGMWAGMLLLAPDQPVSLLSLAWAATLLYPIVVMGSLFIGWRAQQRGQFKIWPLLMPLLYAPVLFIIGFAALWQIAS